MATKTGRKKRKRTGIFVYCSEEIKQRIDQARRFSNRTISGYVLQATKEQLSRDEAAMSARTGTEPKGQM